MFDDDIFAYLGKRFGRDPMVPIKDDPKAEADRLATQWRRYADRIGRLIDRYPDHYGPAR